MGLPKNKKVSEYTEEELNVYCPILFKKSGKPATRGPCKNWSPSGKGQSKLALDLEKVGQEAQDFNERKKLELEKQILSLREQIDGVDALTEKFLKDPNHFNYQLFLENSELESWDRNEINKLLNGESPYLEQDTEGPFGLGLKRLYKTKDGGFAEVEISAGESYTEWETPITLFELEEDSIEFEDHADSDIFPGFYDENVQSDFEGDFINGLTKKEKATYESMKKNLDEKGTLFYKEGKNIPDNQKALCRKIRKLRFNSLLGNEGVKQIQKEAIEEIISDKKIIVPKKLSTYQGDYTDRDLDDDVAEKLSNKLYEYGIVDFNTKESKEEHFVPAGADEYIGEARFFNRLGELIYEDSCGGYTGNSAYDVEGAMSDYIENVDGGVNLDIKE